jgi:hypothetical protein
LGYLWLYRVFIIPHPLLSFLGERVSKFYIFSGKNLIQQSPVGEIVGHMVQTHNILKGIKEMKQKVFWLNPLRGRLLCRHENDHVGDQGEGMRGMKGGRREEKAASDRGGVSTTKNK